MNPIRRFQVLLTIAAILAMAAAPAPAEAGRKLKACNAKLVTVVEAYFHQRVQTAGLIENITGGQAAGEDCFPNGDDPRAPYCPTDCWSYANFVTLSQVCCNPYPGPLYDSNDGVPDGSCITRSAR